MALLKKMKNGVQRGKKDRSMIELEEEFFVLRGKESKKILKTCSTCERLHSSLNWTGCRYGFYIVPRGSEHLTTCELWRKNEEGTNEY